MRACVAALLAFAWLPCAAVAGARVPDAAGAGPFASCTAVLQSVPVTLDLFTARAVLRFGESGAETPEGLVHSLRIDSEDDRGTSVTMFVYETTDKPFARFTIPKAPRSRVEIFAMNVGAVWGTFDCRRRELQERSSRLRRGLAAPAFQ